MPITIELTDIQQTLLADVVALENEQRAAKIVPLPPITLDEWVANELQKAISRGIANVEAVNINRVATAYQNAGPSARAQVKDVLGIVAVPAPLPSPGVPVLP